MKESLVSEKSGQNGTQLLQCFFCDASFYEEQDLSKHLQHHLQGNGVEELGLIHSHREKLSKPEEVKQDRSACETPSMCQDSDGTRVYPSHLDHEGHRSNCTVETIGIQNDGIDISLASQPQKEQVVQMAASVDQGDTQLQSGKNKNIQTGKFRADLSCHPQVEKEQNVQRGEILDQADVSRHPGSEESWTAETGETFHQTNISCQSRSVQEQNSVRHHFQCEHCEEDFETQAKLIFHVTQMSAEKSYSCSKCGSEFSWRCLLLVHSASHCELKPDKCNPLRDRSKSISKKEEHMDGQEWCCKSESEQPRQICGKSLRCSHSTLKSETSHTGTKPQGSESGKRVVTEGNLKKHTAKKNI
nr:zinc finger protein 93-like [Lytechinus pictus]